MVEEILKEYKEGKITIEELKESIKLFGTDRSIKKELSAGQKALWAIEKTSPCSSAYNLPICIKAHIRLDDGLLKKSIEYSAEHHPILKAYIEEENGIPYQVVKEERKLFFESDKNIYSEEKIMSQIRDLAKTPFSIDKDPLMKCYLFYSQNESFFLILIHHIIFDGSSIGILTDSIFRNYYALMNGNVLEETKTEMGFFDYVDWEKDLLCSKEGEAHKEYWEKQLEGELPVIELPTENIRNNSNKFKADTYSIVIPSEIKEKVVSAANQLSITLPVYFIGILDMILYQFSGQKDLIVGMVNRGRPEERFDGSIGYFINMLPIRTQINEENTLHDLFSNLQLTMFDGMDHAEYPFQKIVKDHNTSNNENSSIIQIACYYQNYIPIKSAYSKNEYEEAIPFEYVEHIHQEGEYEFILEVFEKQDSIKLNIKYNADLYNNNAIERIAKSFVRLTEAAADNYDEKIISYPALSKDDEKTVLELWNATDRDYPKDKCVYELFEEQVKKTPDKIAVYCENESITYSELNERSTQLAIYLQKYGVTGDCFVGISTERDLNMIVGLLAILKAGGAYIPLDPLYPKDRIEYIIKNSKMQIILSENSIINKMEDLFENSEVVINMDEQWQEIEKTSRNIDKYEKRSTPDNLAYVLYTSGSTGNPKGVMIPHRALTNFLFDMAKKPGLDADDRLLAITTFCFDIAGLELYLPLIRGACFYLANNETQKNVEKLKKEISRIKPTIMQATPATWVALYKVGWRNEEHVKVLCGGEALPEKLKKYFMDSNSEVWNMFGPTETTIWSTIQLIKAEEPITIGKPIANTYIYILNSHGLPVPIGVAGELYIGGDGLARGYLDLDKLTQERFIDNPFKPGTKMYKTGDLAKWLDSGEIAFLGRMDNQVKIRGYRIEIDEIETRMNLFTGIQQSVVIISEDDGTKQLKAFYLEKEAESVDKKELRAYLKKWLPEYMVPSVFNKVESIPLTPNGKVNRLALAKYKVDNVNKDEETKLNGPEKNESKLQENPHYNSAELENIVRNIWAETIGNNDFSENDGFFEIGGDSINSVTVMERINNAIGCDITVTNIFEYPTLKKICEFINDQMKENNKIGISVEKLSFDEKSEELPDYYDDSVAIIGISCKFPGAESFEQFFENIFNGKESYRHLSKEEQIQLGVSEEIMNDPKYVPIQLSINEKEMFDAGFFKISPKDAEFMDPQMRLLLQASWHAVEDAGYVSEDIPNTAVYMSASNNFYNTENESKKVSVMADSDSYVKWLYSQGGTIPTLISYKLGFKGPSYFVHSNCSSGLVGMYQAYQSICTGRVDYALVGASTLHSLPDGGYVHVNGLNFSSDGHIKAFDSSADGMIGGEGAAVIVMKNARKAVQDGDHIYGLVRGIQLNNDGPDRAGFYAPSVKGQTEVIERTLKTANVDPESICYVETHGTGTKIGDPIEFSALCNAYRKFTDKKGFCGIGSVKTNIGHLDTVAGLAGCIKILMSFKNGVIPSSLNFKEANPEIDFENSPFYLVSKNKKLEQQNTPHRAALSSFGIGGTNGHVIFEEYISSNDPEQDKADESKYIVPLSALSEERLRKYALDLAEYIEKEKSDIKLKDIAYTLQTGRKAMNKRAIFVADSVDMLIEMLNKFVEGNYGIDGIYVNFGTFNKAKNNNIDINDAVNMWITQSNADALAELWLNKKQFDWNMRYKNSGLVQKISLPVYPFAKEYYWKSETLNDDTNPNGVISRKISYPLIDENISDFEEQKYLKYFSGNEFYLVDHVIDNKKVMPGVIYIDLARAAAEIAMHKKIYKLKNIIWMQPFIVEEPKELEIGFEFKNNNIMYQVRNYENNNKIVHSQGMLQYRSTNDTIEEKFDITSCLNRCTIHCTHDDFYEGNGNTVYNYGKTFRPINDLYIGDGEIVSKISVPIERKNTFSSFVLHPSLLEGCLQSVVALMHRSGKDPFMPFSIEKVEILNELSEECYVYATYSDGSNNSMPTKKFNIWLMDKSGRVLLKMKNYSVRTIHPLSDDHKDDLAESIYIRSEWKHSEPDVLINKDDGAIILFDDNEKNFNDLSINNKVIQVKKGNCFRRISKDKYEIDPFQISNYDELFNTLSNEEVSADKIVYYWSSNVKTIDDSLQNSIYNVIRIIKAVSNTQYKKKMKFVVLYDDIDSISEVCFGALSGLLRTVNKEYSEITCKYIGIHTPYIYLDEILSYEFSLNDGVEIRYTNSGRYVRDLIEYEQTAEISFKPDLFRNKGVYVITGGMGKLGSIVAEYLARTYNARIALLSRSDLNEEKYKIIDNIKKLNGDVIFIKADVSQKSDVDNAINTVKNHFGSIHGVFHCAGIADDKLLKNKSLKEVENVISAKVKGAVYLDEALKNEKIDMFVMFSSSSSLGNIGQADYAFANSFLNSIAEYRNILHDSGARFGKTFSIGWPFWEKGGIKMDEATQKNLRKATGMLPLPTEVGLEQLEKILKDEYSSIILKYKAKD